MPPETCAVNAFSQKLRVRLRRLTFRLRAEGEAGSAIIEFAFIAPVFFLLIFSIIEVGVIFFAQSTLQNGTTEIARFIRTGQTQSQGLNQSAVRNKLCGVISPLLACDSNLQLDVEAFDSFGNVNFSQPLLPDGSMNPALQNFQPGTACNVVLVRAFYSWGIITPLLTPFLVNMSNNNHLLYAASAFRNEPYTTGLSGC